MTTNEDVERKRYADDLRDYGVALAEIVDGAFVRLDPTRLWYERATGTWYFESSEGLLRVETRRFVLEVRK